MRDRYSEETIEQLIDPAVATSDVNGSSLDLQGYTSGTIIVSVGESADASSLASTIKFDIEIEHSDDDSTFADCAVGDTVGEVSAGNFGTIDSSADDDAVFTVHYVGSKRYVRPVLNFTGTHTNGTPIGAVGIKRGYKYPPT